ncbi:serine protease [Armillaria mellea]|nr:serine protease [Armillaria mellea]
MASTQLDTTTLTKLQRIDGKVKKDSYIVTLRPGVARKTRDALVDSLGAEATIIARYNHVFSGFAGQFSSGVLDKIHAHPDVVTIVEDGEVDINVEQHHATWGLQRISQKGPLPPGSDPLALTYTYTYDGTATTPVNVYVVDTGIYIENSDFGGRAHRGVTIVGTMATAPMLRSYNEILALCSDVLMVAHVSYSGTIGGTRFGVYKFAEIYDVKWIVINAVRLAIVNMSISAPANTAVDAAVVAVIVSAGNGNIDASFVSPARVEQAITVGASNILDARYVFSNIGSVVDVLAPGEDITSTWIGEVNATNTFSGTSMATPHVTGVAAYFLTQQTDLKPAQIQDEIKIRADNGIVNISDGTVNAY